MRPHSATSGSPGAGSLTNIEGRESAHDFAAFGGAWRGRRVLVTGHTGFKGSWLAVWLQALGARVTGFALAPQGSTDLFERLGLARSIDHRLGDVRDARLVEGLVREIAPDAIVHLAAQSLVRPSYADPLDTFATNTLGTANLLEALRKSARPCTVIVVSSDKCYEPAARAHVESDPLGGHDPYSASKAAAEIVAQSYRRSFFAPERFGEHRVALATARAGNVIGGGDVAAERLVPDILRALDEERAVVLRNPRSIRPWQHVLDALSGYLWLGARMLNEGAEGLAEAWNFGPEPGNELAVEELVRHVHAASGCGRFEIERGRDRPHETAELALDCGKARERLRWRPTWDIRAAVEATVEWHTSARGAQEPAVLELCRTQIGRITADARQRSIRWAQETAAT